MDPQKTPPGKTPTDDSVMNAPTGPAGMQDAIDGVNTPAADATFKSESPVAVSFGKPSATNTPFSDEPNVSAVPASNLSTPESSAQPTLTTVEPPIVPLPTIKPGFGKKGLLLGILIAVIVLLGGGAAATYYFAANSPESVLKQALANSLDTSKAKTVQFSGAVGVDNNKSKMSLEATFKGAANNETGAFDLSSSLDVLVAKFTFDVRSTDGKTYYMKAGGLEGLSQLLNASSSSISGSEAMMLSLYAPMIETLNDQWLEINQSLIKQLTGNTIGHELTEAERQKIIQAYGQNSFIVIKEKLANEAVKGTDSYHFKVGIDKTELKGFMTAVKAANIEGLKFTEDQMKGLNAAIDKANLDHYPVELWIAKDTKLISQVAFKFTEGQSSFNFRFTMDSYNKPVNVEKPAGAKSLLDLMGGLMGSSGFSSDGETTFDADLQSGISL